MRSEVFPLTPGGGGAKSERCEASLPRFHASDNVLECKRYLTNEGEFIELTMFSSDTLACLPVCQQLVERLV